MEKFLASAFPLELTPITASRIVSLAPITLEFVFFFFLSEPKLSIPPPMAMKAEAAAECLMKSLLVIIGRYLFIFFIIRITRHARSLAASKMT